MTSNDANVSELRSGKTKTNHKMFYNLLNMTIYLSLFVSFTTGLTSQSDIDHCYVLGLCFMTCHKCIQTFYYILEVKSIKKMIRNARRFRRTIYGTGASISGFQHGGH